MCSAFIADSAGLLRVAGLFCWELGQENCHIADTVAGIMRRSTRNYVSSSTG